jgi:hypothetical protein
VVDEDMLEMAPLANRFSFFENFKDKEEEKRKQKGRASPHREVIILLITSVSVKSFELDNCVKYFIPFESSLW